MAVVFTEGFDYYNGTGVASTTAVGIASRWTYVTGFLATGRFGGQAYALNNANALNYAALPASYTSGCVGFAVNCSAGNNSTNYAMFAVSSVGLGNTNLGGQGQFQLNINTSGQVEVRRGTTIIATSTATISFGVWSYLETEFVISATVGEVRVYLNNDPTPIINLSGVNNKAQTGSGFSYIVFSTFNGITNQFDDVYVTDTPTRLGEQRVITSYVNGDSSTTNWSSSAVGTAPYTMLDETTCDADVTYAASNTFNSRIVLTVPSLPVPPTTVNAVQIVGFARKDETQFRQVALEYENTAGAVSTGSAYTLNTTYIRAQNLMPQNPLTGTSWTATDVNSMKIGARVVS